MSSTPHTPEETSSPLVVVLTGPSGVGKDSVLAELERLGLSFHRPVTATTRPRRSGDVEGRDYTFVTEPQFREMLAQGELLEHAQVYGYWYGVPRTQVREALDRGQDVIVRTDVQGAATIKRMAPDAVLVFLAPSSLAELEQRLRSRMADTDEQLALRLRAAHQEMEQATWFDHVVENQNGALAQAAERLQAIVEQEKRRTPPRRVSI